MELNPIQIRDGIYQLSHHTNQMFHATTQTTTTLSHGGLLSLSASVNKNLNFVHCPEITSLYWRQQFQCTGCYIDVWIQPAIVTGTGISSSSISDLQWLVTSLSCRPRTLPHFHFTRLSLLTASRETWRHSYIMLLLCLDSFVTLFLYFKLLGALVVPLGHLHCPNLDLDLDSSRIQLDTLGHTPTPSMSVKSCHLCFLPGEPHLS